jgi:diketogulonate reductase-like aldo/keto reductase
MVIKSPALGRALALVTQPTSVAAGPACRCSASARLDHWRGPIPLEETLEAFDRLRGAGKIGSWGVSNFDRADMQDLIDIRGGSEVSTDQVLYNLESRGIEYDLLPWSENIGLPIMAYSPIEQGQVLDHPVLRSVAARHHAAPAQVVLAWVLRKDNVCAIPRASNPAHVRENRVARDMNCRL